LRSVFFALICIFLNFTCAGAQDIILPDFSGGFYPEDPAELSDMIEGFLNEPVSFETQGKDILTVIVPHAGYGYSGKTAGSAYSLLRDKPYKTVVVIGPTHYFNFDGISVLSKGTFRTPLGDLEVDEEFAGKLLDKDKEIYFEPAAFRKEHSIEVQLPFIKKCLPQAKIVLVILGDTVLSTLEKLSELLESAMEGRQDVLIIASSDMYHGYDWEEAKRYDDLALSYIKNMDAKGLYYGIREKRLLFFDGFPAVAALLLAERLGSFKSEVLSYTNSAAVTGNFTKGEWTVGYSACVIYKNGSIEQAQGKPPDVLRPGPSDGPVSAESKGESAMLDKNQRKKLLEIARSSIEGFLKTKKKINITETDAVLTKDMGAFVTLEEHGELRGCIGNIIARQPLYLTVRDMAVEAAVGDPRFPEVSLQELENIEIEISVLSPLERVDSADKIEMGKHGVLIKNGPNSGVFLPQVATETGWTKEEFLTSLCTHKAGLPADAWKDKTTEIYVFSAEVFSENNY